MPFRITARQICQYESVSPKNCRICRPCELSHQPCSIEIMVLPSLQHSTLVALTAGMIYPLGRTCACLCWMLSDLTTNMMLCCQYPRYCYTFHAIIFHAQLSIQWVKSRFASLHTNKWFHLKKLSVHELACIGCITEMLNHIKHALMC